MSVSAGREAPIAGDDAIVRNHLVRCYDRMRDARLITVCVPAGYGKTTAIQCWAELFAADGRPVFRVGGRMAGRTAVEFVELAMDRREIDFDPSEPDEFVAAMSERGARPVLQVDDAHLLSAEIRDLLARLIVVGGDNLTLLIAARGTSPIPVGRLRVHGRLAEISAEDLSLDIEAGYRMLAGHSATPAAQISSGQIAKLMDGWVAGIVLARRLGVRCGDAEGPPGDLEQAVRDYFEEEILDRLEPEIVQFLQDIALLDQIDPAGASAVTGRRDSGERLEALVAQGLFLRRDSTHDGRYRMQPVFRDMLRRRQFARDSAHCGAIHERAAEFQLKQGQLLSAIRHVDASGNLDLLARTLEEVAEELTYRSHIEIVVELAGKLPWSILSRCPGIMLCLAWREIRSLAISEAEALLEATETELRRRRDCETADLVRLARLERLFRHREVMLAAARDDMPEVAKRSAELLEEFGGENIYIRCTLLGQMIAARRELFRFDDMLKLEAEMRRILRLPGSEFASIALKAAVAPTLAMLGKTSVARELLQQSLAIAERYDGKGSGLAALPALPLAELSYELDDLETARDLVERHLGVARKWGFADQLSAGHIVRARLLASEGKVDDAMAALDEAVLTALECGLDRLRNFAVCAEVHILLRAGRAATAEQAVRRGEIDLSSTPVPTLSPSRTQEAIAVIWLRMQIQQARLRDAGKVARRWQNAMRRVGAVRSIVTFDLLQARIAALGGNRSEAHRHVRSALELAAGPGWLRPFIDEGETIADLIREAYGEGPRVEGETDHFCRRLLSSIDAKSPSAEPEGDRTLTDQLMKREVDVLSLAAAGLSNREIGNRLGLTEGSVKWYMQQIYDKLGVRRRALAVMRARSLGLLPEPRPASGVSSIYPKIGGGGQCSA